MERGLYNNRFSGAAEQKPEQRIDIEKMCRLIEERETQRVLESKSVPHTPEGIETSVPTTVFEDDAEHLKAEARVQKAFDRLEAADRRIPAGDPYRAEVTRKVEVAVDTQKKKRLGLNKIIILGSAIFSIGTVLLKSELPIHIAERPQVERVVTPEGTLEYRHTDQETTDMLNSMVEDLDLTAEEEAAVKEKLWKLEAEVGSPLIRWADSSPQKYASLGSAWLDPNTMTIYVERDNAFADTISEFTHAKQLTDHPEETRIRKAREDRTYPYASTHYSQRFAVPGTLEYEAHQEIEPQLQSRFPEVDFRDH